MEASFEGTWRIVDLDFSLMERIVMWNYNHLRDEMLTKELFVKYFGNHMGEHFYEKWEYTFKRNLLEMFSYFRSEYENGQKFCDLLMEQVHKYIQRIRS